MFTDTQEVSGAMKQLFAAFFLTAFSLLAQAQNPGLPDFTELVEKHGAAVVNVSTTQTARASGRGALPFPFDENDPMYEFFRRFIPRQPGMPGFPGAPREFESRSLGSGFIVSADGYILTNAHVVEAADEIVVRLTDKRELKARVIGADKRTDVALIKIEASGLPTVRLGDPGVLKVGEWVVAIGSPFGFDNSVTAGIVSAKGRSLPQESYVPFIQTDVAVNPGNSGGPLLNLSGEVIGINAQINTTNQAGGVPGNSGVGFSIPASIVAKVAPALIETGKMTWSFLGVSGLPEDRFTVEVAKANGLSEPIGAYILGVPADGPSAGILRGIDEPASNAQQLPLGGDIIIGIDDQPVQSFDDLLAYIAIRTEPGQTVELKLLRGGEEVTERVTVAERK